MNDSRFLVRFVLYICSSLYLTTAISVSTDLTPFQTVFLFVYFFLISLGVREIYNKYTLKKEVSRKPGVIVASLILGMICVTSCHSYLFPESVRPVAVSVTATGEKNEASNASEVWITKITVDGEEEALTDLLLPEGWWQDESGAILCNPDKRLEPLVLSFESTDEISISLVRHEWSGIVELQTNDEPVERVDLYGKEKSEYVYLTRADQIKIAPVVKAAGYVFFCVLFYVLLQVTQHSNGKFGLFLYILCALFAWNGLTVKKSGYGSYLLLVVFGAVLAYLLALVYWKQQANKWTQMHRILFTAVDVIITFQFTAEFLFMKTWQTTVNIQQISTFLLSSIVMVPVLLAICFLIEWLEERITKQAIQYADTKQTRTRRCIFLVLLAACVTLVFSQILPEYMNVSHQPSEITIRILEERNKKSNGYEVLLSSQAIVDGQPQELEIKHITGDWDYGSDYLWGLSAGSEVTLSFPKAKDIDLQFNKHAWSGKIEIIDQGKVQEIDLFSQSDNDYLELYHVQGNTVQNANPFLIFILSLLIGLVVAAIIAGLLYTTEHICSLKWYEASVFSAIVMIWSLYLVSGNPGSLSIDSINQLSQAQGLLPITDAHPAFLTMCYRWMLGVFGDPISITIFQIILFAAVVAAYCRFFAERGLSKRFISLLAVLFALHIVNGIYATVLWKDVLFTVSLLYVTLLLMRLAVEKKEFFTLCNILKLGVCLPLVILLRHNGIVVFLLAGIVLIGSGFVYRSWKPWMIVIVAVSVVTLVKGPLYDSYGIQKNELTANSGFLHGMVYTGLATGDFHEVLLEIAEPEIWEAVYNPYSSNEFAYSEAALKENLQQKIRSVPSSEINKAYVETFFQHPFLLIKDRLYGCNLLWNNIPSGYNWRTGNDEYEVVVTSNSLGYYCRENLLTDITSNIYEASVSSTLSDMLIWRAGPYLSLGLLLFVLSIVNKKYGLILAMVPLLGNSLSLAAAMAWQDYRYVYFVFVCVCFIFLSYLALSPQEIKEHCNKDENVDHHSCLQ